MNSEGMQARAAAFCARHDLSLDAPLRFIDLTSEIGELGKSLLKATEYGAKPAQYTDETRLELGDCLFALLALGTSLDVDMEWALEAALAKYEVRYTEKGSIGS